MLKAGRAQCLAQRPCRCIACLDSPTCQQAAVGWARAPAPAPVGRLVPAASPACPRTAAQRHPLRPALQDVTLAPLASDMLARMLALARDALDMAITMAAPNPADWPAAYGAALPQLLEPLPFESPSDAASEDPVDAGTQAEEAEEDLPAMHAEPADGGAAAKAQPPLPAGEPPALRRRLRQSPSSQDDQYYYDESYDDAEDDYR